MKTFKVEVINLCTISKSKGRSRLGGLLAAGLRAEGTDQLIPSTGRNGETTNTFPAGTPLSEPGLSPEGWCKPPPYHALWRMLSTGTCFLLYNVPHRHLCTTDRNCWFTTGGKFTQVPEILVQTVSCQGQAMPIGKLI